MSWSGSAEKWPWESWCRQSVSRLQLEIHLVRFRAELYHRGHRHVDQLQEAVDSLRQGIRDAAVWLRSEADRIAAHLGDAAEVRVELRALTEHDRVCVERIETEFLSRLRTFSAAPDGPVSTGDRLAEAILRLQGSQPESFTVHPLAEGDVPDPDDSTVQFEFRRVVSQCFDALLIDRLGRATVPFIELVGQVRAKAETIPSIIESGLMAMSEALEAEEGTAEELAIMIPDTLRRAADVAEETRSDLWMGQLEQRVCDLMEVGWLKLAPRAVVSSGMGEQLAGLKSDARQAAREAARQAWGRLATEYRRFVARAARGGRFVRGAFRMLEPPAIEEGTPTASPTQELLGRAGAFAQDLPLVYRRLFTFGPLREPDLLLGRSEVVTRILVAARANGERRPLILVAEPAAGVSSVFNAVQAGRLQKQVVQVRVTERVANSRELIEQFGRARIEVPGENLSGLSEAAKRLLPGDEVPVMLVEGLEHAFTRGAGGQGLVERFLAVMRESASEVVWAASISSSAWQVITVASPHVAAGIDVMTIGPLSRVELEATLWKRHQRSGIPLRFSNPRDPNPILRRKLKRASVGGCPPGAPTRRILRSHLPADVWVGALGASALARRTLPGRGRRDRTPRISRVSQCTIPRGVEPRGDFRPEGVPRARHAHLSRVEGGASGHTRGCGADPGAAGERVRRRPVSAERSRWDGGAAGRTEDASPPRGCADRLPLPEGQERPTPLGRSFDSAQASTPRRAMARAYRQSPRATKKIRIVNNTPTVPRTSMPFDRK